MASTPNPSQPQPHQIPIKTAARKLPIKRKTPDTPFVPHPNPNFSPTPVPKIEDEDIDRCDLKPPPFKFHRIWPEYDEIRFLQGLLECSGDGLAFPRDLHVFYDRFSQSMSQPYTRSQLSEKLRRLRKKFRVTSGRIARGLDPSLLSSHDRALYDISKQLWHPSYSSSSPFLANSNQNKSTRVRVKVTFSPNPALVALPDPTSPVNENNINYVDNDGDVDMTGLNYESNIGVHEEETPLPIAGTCGGSSGGGLGRVAAKTVLDVFDKSLKDVRTVLIRHGLLYPDHSSTNIADSSKNDKAAEFRKRWHEQQVAELDVLARRLRLVLENSLQ